MARVFYLHAVWCADWFLSAETSLQRGCTSCCSRPDSWRIIILSFSLSSWAWNKSFYLRACVSSPSPLITYLPKRLQKIKRSCGQFVSTLLQKLHCSTKTLIFKYTFLFYLEETVVANLHFRNTLETGWVFVLSFQSPCTLIYFFHYTTNFTYSEVYLWVEWSNSSYLDNDSFLPFVTDASDFWGWKNEQ